MTSLRSRQQQSLLSILTTTKKTNTASVASVAGSPATPPSWHVLIYDEFVQRLIAPLLSVSQLRSAGVTLHLSLGSTRSAIPAADAVYLVCATDEAITTILTDVRRTMYRGYYLNFIGTLSDQQLTTLAEGMAAMGAQSAVRCVAERHLGFVSLEDDLFHLAMAQSFLAFHDRRVSDAAAEAQLDRVVTGLYGVVATLGVLPVIRAPRNGAADMIASRLAARLAAAHAADPDKSTLVSATRPLLIIVERTVDTAGVLHHPWAYGPLVADVLGARDNRVTLPDEATSHDLSVESDAFWQKFRGAPFQEVAAGVKEALDDYRREADKVSEVAGGSGGDEGVLRDQTASLASFVSTIPELRRRKAQLDAHTAIATALLNAIKARQLDAFYRVEENPDAAELRRLVADPAATVEDKLRLLAIARLTDLLPNAVADEAVEQLTQEVGDDPAARRLIAGYHYAAQLHSQQLQLAAATPSSTGSSSAGGASTSGSLLASLSTGSSSTRPSESLGEFLSMVTGGVERLKSLLPTARESALTLVLDALMEGKAWRGVEHYGHWDPATGGTASAPPQRRSAPAKSAIVFLVGGGTYAELQNVREYAAKGSRNIVYGGTELFDAVDFLGQLGDLQARR